MIHVNHTNLNISPFQVLAMAKIFMGNAGSVRKRTHARNFKIDQTWTPTGGTHLYVEHGGDKFHISARGRVVKLDV